MMRYLLVTKRSFVVCGYCIFTLVSFQNLHLVGVAAMLQSPEKFKDARVGIIICGSNLTEEQMKTWL